MSKPSIQPLHDILGLLTVALAIAAAYALFNALPVSPQDEQDAAVLSRTGPHGARAYANAIFDGKITSRELRTIRQAAGTDIDASDFFTRKPG